MKTIMLFAVLIMIAGVLLGGCLGPPIDSGIPVADVDLERYAGTWYEIASLPTFFSSNLVCVTATYTIRPDGKVDVFNEGFQRAPGGLTNRIRGTAWVPNPQVTGRLKVSFFPFSTSEYNVIALDQEDYQYAMVTSSTANFLWILSRTPQMDPAVLRSLVSLADSWGFAVDRLEMTPQLCH